jgi:hypothetical protein
MVEQTAVVKGLFMGDPSHEYEHTELQKVNDGEKVFDEEVVVSADEGRKRAKQRKPGSLKASLSLG